MCDGRIDCYYSKQDEKNCGKVILKFILNGFNFNKCSKMYIRC